MSGGRAGTGALALCAAILAALAGAPAAMAQVAFPSTPFGASSANEDLVLVNEDPDPIALARPAVVGPDAAAFQVVTDTCGGAMLPGDGGECTVTMAFSPAEVGPHTATLEVPVEGEPDAPFTAELSGEGIPWLRLTPTVLDFGTVLPFFAPPRDVLVENVSGREVSLFARIDPVTGDFRFHQDFAPDRCGRTLAAGATCRVGVTFLAYSAGAAEARLTFGSTRLEIGSVTLRGTGVPRPPAAPIPFPTPDATSVLRKRLRAALQRLRGGSRNALLKHGLVVRGIVPPAEGVLGLTVDASRASSAPTLVAARRRLPVQTGRRTTIRAHLTRAGRRLLRGGRRLVLDVTLTLVARPDSRLSEAKGALRLGRAPQPGRHAQPRSP